MTSRVRFALARDVFEAFPLLSRFVPAPADDVEPLEYARRLQAGKQPLQAVALLAHTLPRREAVWWGRCCVTALTGAAGEDDCARAAEAWVRAPEEPTRRAALELGLASSNKRPTTWLALAAGRSGGSLSAPDKEPVAPAPEACAQAVGAAITLAIVAKDPREIHGWIEACVAGGVAFAQGGGADVRAPAPGRSPRPPAGRSVRR